MRQKTALTISALLALISCIALTSSTLFAAQKLIVKDSTGQNNKFVVTDDGTGLTVNDAGQVGINNSTPAAGLHIKGDAYPSATVKVEGTPTGGGGGYLGYLVRQGALPLNNDRLGYFLFGSTDGTNLYHATGLTAMADGDWSSTSTPAYFSFLTTPTGSATRVERMRIASSGNIGINTSTPQATLDVQGGVRINAASSQPACANNLRGTIWFTQGTGSTKDSLQVCVSTGSGYTWFSLY